MYKQQLINPHNTPVRQVLPSHFTGGDDVTLEGQMTCPELNSLQWSSLAPGWQLNVLTQPIIVFYYANPHGN